MAKTLTRKFLGPSEIKRVFKDLGLETQERRDKLVFKTPLLESDQPTETAHVTHISDHSKPEHDKKG